MDLAESCIRLCLPNPGAVQRWLARLINWFVL
jgi:hypothetical protein